MSAFASTINWKKKKISVSAIGKNEVQNIVKKKNVTVAYKAVTYTCKRCHCALRAFDCINCIWSWSQNSLKAV